MMVHDYWLESLLLKERFGQIQAFFETQALARSLRPPRRPALRYLGMALIKAGRYILRHAPEWTETEPTSMARAAHRAGRGA
jgi:hypothetical protein